ncbi:MAG: type 1 glutamine amidotransferase [Chlorobiaceae bacterium]|nr:type 1 glutamine amidotransferase [Chlorobiaceae bacterium]NTV61496.1 type 1 glutamine amidotransferase [Chlorobiaceae bacterium]
MPTPLLIIKNIAHEGPGLLETALALHGIVPHVSDISKGEAFPDPSRFGAVVVLGGPSSANDETAAMQEVLRQTAKAITRGIPYLGICLGMQTLVKAGGGKVVRCPVKEIGFRAPDGSPFRIDLTETGTADPLFEDLGKSFRVFQLHGETVELASSGMEVLGTGTHCPVQAVRVGKTAYGLQCHFELTKELLREWLDIDADLKTMDTAVLLRQFEAIREVYSATGLRLMNNFLRIAGLA